MTMGASNFPPAVREKGEKGGELAAGEILASSRLTVLLLCTTVLRAQGNARNLPSPPDAAAAAAACP